MFDLKGFRQAFGLTQNQLAEILDCGQPNISAMEKSMKDLEPLQKKILDDRYGEDSVRKFTIVNGSLLENEIREPALKNITNKTINTTLQTNYRLIPVIHIDSVGGMHSNNEISDEPQYVEQYVPFINAREDDKAIYHSGNSMIPTIPPGSLLHIREVKQWREYFGYGCIYVIELKDGRRLTKEVAKSEEDPHNYILCKSHNPNVADEELPRDMIASVWKVINILTNNGW